MRAPKQVSAAIAFLIVAVAMALSLALRQPVSVAGTIASFALAFFGLWGLIFNLWMIRSGREQDAFRLYPGAEGSDAAQPMSARVSTAICGVFALGALLVMLLR